MDTQFLFNLFAGLAIGVGGWLARQLWDSVQRLKEEVHQIEVDLPRHYIRKDEFKDVLKEIRDIQTEIFRKIDDLRKDKVDK
jgi:3-isopropylmalate dehydratase small subunit